MTIQKEVLQKIWDYLEKQITSEDRKWLKKHRSAAWSKTEVSEEHTRRVYNLRFRIKDALDAKAGRTWMIYKRTLTKNYLVELAQLLNLKVSEKETKETIVAKISKAVS
jgi:hypothetical protein